MSLACLVLACTQSGICSAPIFEPSSSNNKVVLCCFLISSIAKTYPRVKGGYKALRRFLIDETYRIMQQITPIVIGGQTGCGKTHNSPYHLVRYKGNRAFNFQWYFH
jgi:hypothetical protein